MKFNKITTLGAIAALLFLASQASFAQLSHATALLKGDAAGASGTASDVSVMIYKGSEMVNKTKVTPEGKFTVVLQPGNQYRLTFSGPKYYYHEEQLSVPASDKYQEVPLHVMLKELEIGKPYQFSDLVFEPKSSDISATVIPDMENIAAAMKRNQSLTISATVYPDEMPSGKKAAVQNSLADSRKSALMSFFLSKNIDASHVLVEINTSVPATGVFERTIIPDPPATKGKKKKKAPAAATTGKKVMIPQYAVITMQMAQ